MESRSVDWEKNFRTIIKREVALEHVSGVGLFSWIHLLRAVSYTYGRGGFSRGGGGVGR